MTYSPIHFTPSRSHRYSGAPFAAPLALALLWSQGAAAQASGLGKDKSVSGGSKDVAGEGFQAANKAAEESAADSTSLQLMAGGLWSAGNARVLAGTGSADFRMRRSQSQFSALAAVNLARSAVDSDTDVETTVENYQGQVRYDYFFGKHLASFLNISGRRDKFQGLALRTNIDPGVAYYAVDSSALKLWTEFGYDLQHDIRDNAYLEESAADPDIGAVPKTATRHSLRLLLGYDHAFSEQVKFDTYIEYIQALDDTVNYRINGSAALTSQVAGSLSVASSITIRYDHNPLEGIEATDVVSAFNLVYSL